MPTSDDLILMENVITAIIGTVVGGLILAYLLTTVIPKLRDLLSKLLGVILRLIVVISRFWFRVWNFIIYRQYEDVICGAKWCWKKCWWKNRNEITDLQGFCKDCDVKMNFIRLGATEYFSCPRCRSRAMRGLIQETIIMKPDIIKKIEQKKKRKRRSDPAQIDLKNMPG